LIKGGSLELRLLLENGKIWGRCRSWDIWEEYEEEELVEMGKRE
jgi:hypothetical protein